MLGVQTIPSFLTSRHHLLSLAQPLAITALFLCLQANCSNPSTLPLSTCQSGSQPQSSSHLSLRPEATSVDRLFQLFYYISRGASVTFLMPLPLQCTMMEGWYTVCNHKHIYEFLQCRDHVSGNFRCDVLQTEPRYINSRCFECTKPEPRDDGPDGDEPRGAFRGGEDNGDEHSKPGGGERGGDEFRGGESSGDEQGRSLSSGAAGQRNLEEASGNALGEPSGEDSEVSEDPLLLKAQGWSPTTKSPSLGAQGRRNLEETLSERSPSLGAEGRRRLQESPHRESIRTMSLEAASSFDSQDWEGSSTSSSEHSDESLPWGEQEWRLPSGELSYGSTPVDGQRPESSKRKRRCRRSSTTPLPSGELSSGSTPADEQRPKSSKRIHKRRRSPTTPPLPSGELSCGSTPVDEQRAESSKRKRKRRRSSTTPPLPQGESSSQKRPPSPEERPSKRRPRKR